MEIGVMIEKGARVGVVGAGAMGTEIAFCFALAGFDVVVYDNDGKKIENLMLRGATIYDKGVARGSYEAEHRAAVLASLSCTQDIGNLRACELVTEAVFENEGVKAAVLRQLDGICDARCVIATNTSTIPISVLSSYVSEERRPRFIGTHYFSPASRMKLVEVIPGLSTSPDTIGVAVDVVRRLGKQPVEIKDVPGFAVNRLLHVFMIEAVRLVEEGVATPEDIDLACRLGLGHPMGPFQLMDATTSSLCLEAQEIMHAAYGERFRPRPLLKQHVRAGLVGGRGRQGWLKR
jgi:3-hydroxybutyryl-CoA dehydrogenase